MAFRRFSQNRITSLLGIDFPVIQAGMIWCSGWRLASAVSNAGGLGVIGAGSMTPELLEEHIVKCRQATTRPFGVNLPLLYDKVEQQLDVIIRGRVPVVITSAGNPAKFTPLLKAQGIIVLHVVANVKSALKCVSAGVDGVIAEGFEAGGHNGKEETTTFVLIPLIRQAISLPLIAAGGIATGEGMLAAMVLGADGVQIGSRFVASEEASAHPHFKQRVVDTGEGETFLALKKVVPVRLITNPFYQRIRAMEDRGADADELTSALGKGRARLGMFDGELEEGELEIGQAAALIKEILPAEAIMDQMIGEYNTAIQKIV